MLRTRLALAAAVLAVFGAVLWGPFQYDDHSLFAGSNVWLSFQTRPLTYLTFWLNGSNPAAFHAVNLALHLGTVLLLYANLSRLLPAKAATIAAFAFALHPVQVEPVAYIFARGTLLATLLCLVSLHFWLRDRHWWAVAWFALALAAKEECAAFPVFLLLLRPANRRALAAMFASAAAAVSWVAIASALFPGSGAGAQAGISPWSYFLTQGTVIFRYLRLLIVPYGLTVDPDIRPAGPFLGLFCWIALAALAGLAWRTKPGRWFVLGFVLLIPTSSVFPAADLAADRRLYLPMLAISAGVGVLLERAHKSTFIVFLITISLLSVYRVGIWGSEERLWADAAGKAPEKARPRNELGRIYMDQGRYQEALQEFGRAVGLDPRDATAYNNRGAAFLALGLREPAIDSFRQALSIDPCLASARTNLGQAGVDTGGATAGCR